MEYIISFLVVAVFIGVIAIWIKKEHEICKNLVSNLTEEQKKELEDNQIENFDSKKHTWIQKAMIAEVTVKGENKVALKVLWYNTIIQNATLNQFQYADISMKKTEFDSKGLKQGDFVKMFMDPEKGAKIVTD